MKKIIKISTIFLLYCLQCNSQKIDSVSIICTDIYAESRGGRSKEMLLSLYKNPRTKLCNYGILSQKKINQFYRLLRKRKSYSSLNFGVDCTVLIRSYSNGEVKDEICTNSGYMTINDDKNNYDSKEIIKLFKLKKICNLGCEMLILNLPPDEKKKSVKPKPYSPKNLEEWDK
jgi:hypothetical protein